MRIAIIGGAGRVGSQVAYTLVVGAIPIDKIQLYDIVDSVNGEAIDLQQAARALGKRLVVKASTLEECYGADIVIFAAGRPVSKGNLSRNALAKENAKILQDVLEKLNESHSIFIIITNPVDVLTQLAAKFIGDRHRVLGISTLTDMSRMDGPGYLIGEHGGHMVAIGNENVDIEKIRQVRADVIKLKGGTWFAVASVVRRVVCAIVNDEKAMIPVSCSLRGEFGFSDVALSVPCIIGKNGIERVEKLSLTKEQRETLNEAAESVRDVLSNI